MNTPSFLVWALARHCSLRQIADWEDAERTERLLRAARAYDAARAEGRIVEGVALAAGADREVDAAQVLGFRVDSALELYGGVAGLQAACDECGANALRGHGGRQVAGCFGMWPLPADLENFCEQVESIIQRDPQIATLSTTAPRWYGLWLHSPLASETASALAVLLRELQLTDAASAAGRDELLLALAISAAGQFPLHFRHYPPGQVEGPWWNLVPHCGDCQAPLTGGGICRVCGQTTHPASPKKRRVRGQRPYYPLVRLLG
ncbi:MAG: hypothetical protein WEH44_00580, partial [Pirellulaceae bacterium]